MKKVWIRSGILAALACAGAGVTHAQSYQLRGEQAVIANAAALTAQQAVSFPFPQITFPQKRMDTQQLTAVPLADERVFDRQ